MTDTTEGLTSEDEEQLPRRFGPYVLFDKIGEGGMARIYLAHRGTELGGERLVVVKQILPMLARSESFCRLLVEEAKLSAQLSHASIAQVFDLRREESTLYIAMEYVEGFDLRDLLRHCSRGRIPLPVEFAVLVVMETLRALDYAHRKRGEDGQPLNIVHRDVSPSNVLISFSGEVKLCDFGIARAMGPEGGSVALDETVQGKASYMSPEAARGQRLDGRSDLFAVGVILWELLAGRRLRRGKGEPGPDGKPAPPTLAEVSRQPVPPLPQRGLPEEGRLRAMLAGALALQAEDRPGSCREFMRQLEDYAVRCGLPTSSLRFGQWLMAHFGDAIIERRRAREVAAKRALAFAGVA